MLKSSFLRVFIVSAVITTNVEAQIVINEASNRNYTQVSDEDGDQYDWFELYNSGSIAISLNGWSISDDKNSLFKWIFPDYNFEPNNELLVFASGIDIKNIAKIDHWESAILPSDTFRYLEPVVTTSTNWNTIGFNVSLWGTGIAGFGFGNGDDSTITNTTSPVVYIRRIFTIPDTSLISDAVLHIDYDDGFVAYLNGVEIGRSNIDGTPTWNSLSNNEHTALMWQGGTPEKFALDMNFIRSIWNQGDNIFAIEVHNASNTSSDLSLIPFLSFAISDTSSFFQAVPIWLEGSTGISLHTNFKIKSKGETLYLSSPDSILVDSLTVPHLQLNCSVGRTTDGATNTGIFLLATPGRSNNTSQCYTNGYEPTPEFNIPAGFYSPLATVVIMDSSSTSIIYYTTDGSEPDESSILYTGGSIFFPFTKTLKAKCFSTIDKMPSETQTATYFVNTTYTLPVISVSTDNENLYGPTGIFDNWGETWNKPCYVEYFNTEKILQFNQEAGIQVDGGAGGSRSNPQHSFRIEPGNGTFGAGDVNYVLIPDKPNRSDYSSFYLRNGSNQYATLQYKDALEVKAIGKNTYNYYSGHTPVVAFINGDYFGVYELREKLNADFFSENYLMDTDSMDLLTLSYFKGSVLEALEGSTDQFWIDFGYFKTLAPSSSTYLNDVSEFLDLNNYTDYIIAQSWICNTDWPWNNIRALRSKSTNYHWQFALQDVEWSLEPNGWSNASTDHLTYMFSQDNNLPYIGFWLRLIQNEQYKFNFINRFADLMNTNYKFSIIGPMEQDMYKLQYPEMDRYFNRWNNSSLSIYNTSHNTLRSQLERRTGYVRQQLQSHFNLSKQIEVTMDVYPAGAGQIKISTITPVNYPWEGIYFSDVPVTFTALANPGYRFAYWNENSLINNLDVSSFTVIMDNNSESFTANFEIADDEFEGVTISEIHYKNGINENSTDWFEIYNGGGSVVDLSGWYFTDKDSLNRFAFKAIDYIPPHSRIVVAKNILAFTLRYPEVTNLTGIFSFKLGSLSDIIRLYDNYHTLRSEVAYSDIFPWPLNGDETGRTLELRNPTGDLNDPNNWFAGCIGGSPGNAFSPCHVPVDIHELNIESPMFSAYPVPATDFVDFIITSLQSNKKSTIKLYDVFGNLVKIVQPDYIMKGINTIQVNLSDLPTGILIAQYESEREIKSIKIIHVNK